MVDAGKREDNILEALFKAMQERDQAREDLAAEKVKHRVTKKELLETVELALK